MRNEYRIFTAFEFAFVASLLLALDDVFYTKGALLSVISPGHLITTSAAIVMDSALGNRFNVSGDTKTTILRVGLNRDSRRLRDSHADSVWNRIGA